MRKLGFDMESLNIEMGVGLKTEVEPAGLPSTPLTLTTE